MTPSNDILFSSDLWKPALQKYASATHVTVKLFATDLRIVFGPVHPTPLFELFDCGGYDPGLFVECARRCLVQTTERPAVTVTKMHGLAVIGTSLVLDGKIVGAAVAGYVLVDFSQLSEIQRVAKDARLDFSRLWHVAREQSPVSQQRITMNGELLQALGDALLRENARTRQYEHISQELQQTASVLRESEERYRTLFDVGPIAVYSCDASGVIRDYNHVAVELWGREPKRGDTDDRWCGSYKLYRPDGVFMPHEQCPMVDVLSGKVAEVRDAEVQIERPNGSRVTVLANIRPLKNEQGQITGVINCFVDITQRRQAEGAVRASEERFRTLANTVPQLAWTCDLLGNVTWYNQRWLDYTGLSFEEMKGWGWSKVQHPDYLDRVVARVKRSSETGEPWEDTFPLRGKNGEYHWFLSRALPIRDEQGKIVQWFGTNTDITDQRRAEEVLREAKSTLEARVKERTSELEVRNAEILAQSDQLQDLSLRLMRTQDEERRRISRELHDSLGQYLASAKMSIEALRRPDPTAKESRNIQQAVDTLEKCLTETRTISHLLHPPLLDEVGFSSAAKWYIEGFSERSGIQANVDIVDEPQRLSPALELVLFRILQESLVNVHRHSHSQSVDIKLASTPHEVTLEVRDHGQGMPSEMLKRFRAKDGLGGGVGLRSMSGRIHELGGSFQIQSDENGTLIRVTAPVPESSTKSDLAFEKASGE